MSDTVRLSSDGIFYTLQGEGPLIGVPSVFVRLDTCNLKCKWGDILCDAHYTSWTPSGSKVEVDQLLERVAEALAWNSCGHLVITGGEPTLQPDVVRELADFCSDQSPHIHTTLETNGTTFVEDHNIDLICLSPKLKSSIPIGTKYEKVHTRNRYQPEVLRRWMDDSPEYYYKFVVDTKWDMDEIFSILGEVRQVYPDPEHIVLMPQGIDQEDLAEKGKWLAEICKTHGMRFTPRLQITLWGNKPGT